MAVLNPLRVFPIGVVEKSIGVLIVMAVEQVAGAVKLPAAATSDDLDIAASRPSIPGLLVRRQHLEFGDSINV